MHGGAIWRSRRDARALLDRARSARGTPRPGPRSLWLWLAANLTIADYALGFLPVTLGLPLGPTLAALALGNLLGGALLALCAAMGPRAGFPQMLIGRRAFGHLGGYGPALLNWVRTAGWFTVNTILGAFAVQVLLPGLPFAIAALATDAHSDDFGQPVRSFSDSQSGVSGHAALGVGPSGGEEGR